MRLASVSERGRALFIDSLWWTLIALFVPLGPSLDTMPLSPDALAADMILWLMLAQCVPILLTGVLWTVWRTTPGKHVLRLRIVDADSGEPMTPRQSILRTVGYLLTFAMCGAGFFWIWFNPRKQALHDRIANTVVVTGRPA